MLLIIILTSYSISSLMCYVNDTTQIHQWALFQSKEAFDIFGNALICFLAES